MGKRTVKRVAVVLSLLLTGAILGAGAMIVYVGRHAGRVLQVAQLQTSAELGDLAYKVYLGVYLGGDFNSSVIALNYVSSYLEEMSKVYGRLPRGKGVIDLDMLETDSGLVHARLFRLYEREGKSELAEKEYARAIDSFKRSSLAPKDVSSKDKLRELVEMLDKGGRRRGGERRPQF